MAGDDKGTREPFTAIVVLDENAGLRELAGDPILSSQAFGLQLTTGEMRHLIGLLSALMEQ